MTTQRSLQVLRALSRPVPMLGMAMIAVTWLGLYVLCGSGTTIVAADQRLSVHISVALVLTLLQLMTIVVGIRRYQSLERTNLRFNTALENMTHGLCMFDADKRLVICNERYASLYRLPPELLKVGTTHEAIIAHRVMNGLLKGEQSAAQSTRSLAPWSSIRPRRSRAGSTNLPTAA